MLKIREKDYLCNRKPKREAFLTSIHVTKSLVDTTMATVTLYRKELKERILHLTMQEFKREGIKKVKMDDIARMLGISKRTLYEIYHDKEELLFEGVKSSEENIDFYLRDYAANTARNAMDVIIEFYHIQMNDFAKINPIFLVELHKYPRIMEYLSNRHKEREGTSQQFFDRGVEEGFFRSDVNYDIVSSIGNGALRYVMESQMYKCHSFEQIFKNVFFLFIRGFCTEKGIAVIDSLSFG